MSAWETGDRPLKRIETLESEIDFPVCRLDVMQLVFIIQ